MKNYKRDYALLSLCGLNCGLCTMHIDGYCPGCGGGDGHQSCKIVKCAITTSSPEFCSLCSEYPCKNYEHITDFDSFITHQNMFANLKKINNIGIEQYKKELEEKIKILNLLLNKYNDGRKKSFYCLAVNLLELNDINEVISKLNEKTRNETDLKKKAKIAQELFNSAAKNKNITLKLNKKRK